jgi:phytoene desaturase
MRTVTGRTDHVVVVGAGLAGLSAALHLLGAGRRVTVVERDAVPGGRAGRLDLGGYRFDTGPTVLTMPELVDEALNAVGDSLADRLDLRPVRPAYRARFADGSTLDVHADGEAMEAEVRRFAGPREAEGYRALRRWLTELYRVERERFIGSNFDSPLSLLTPELAKLAGLRGFARLGPSVARFVRDERLQRVFSFQSLYAGVPPRKALAAYAVIAYMDTIAGVHYPEGGMRALPDALAAAARDAGADLRFQTPVAWLERIGGRVTAVRTTHGERIPCDAVVLTPDLPMSYRLLGHRPRRTCGPARSTGTASARPTATSWWACWRRAGSPGSATRSRSSTWSRRRTGPRWAWPRAPRSRPRTRSRRPGRSGRATWCSTTRCWPAAAPRRASACRRC